MHIPQPNTHGNFVKTIPSHAIWTIWSCIPLTLFCNMIILLLCHNPNIGLVTKCEVQGPMRSRMWLGVKHTLINGGECKGWNPMTFKCNLNLGVAFMCVTPKCTLVHFGFHYILNEFTHFYLVKLVNPLMNKNQLLQTMDCFTKVILKWNINLSSHSLVN
jgi:hypothetical protein